MRDRRDLQDRADLKNRELVRESASASRDLRDRRVHRVWTERKENEDIRDRMGPTACRET